MPKLETKREKIIAAQLIWKWHSEILKHTTKQFGNKVTKDPRFVLSNQMLDAKIKKD